MMKVDGKRIGRQVKGRKTFSVAMTLLLGLLAPCCIAVANPSPSVGSVPFAEARRRESAWQKWLKDAEAVAKRDPEAQATLVFLKTKVALAAPNKDGGATTIGFKQPSAVLLVIMLLPGDENRHEQWRHYVTQQAGALFVPTAKEPHLVVDSTPLSKTWRGFILHREGYAAKRFAANRPDPDDAERLLVNELAARKLQCRLMAIVGGQAYEQDIRNKEVQRLRSVLQKEGREVGQLFPASEAYHPLNERIFGPARSDAERDLRQTDEWIDAQFHLLDEDYIGDKERRKLLFLDRLYAQAEKRKR